MSGVTFKNTYEERQGFGTRIVVAGLFILLLLGILLTRLLQLQTVQHEYFATRSNDNRMRAQPVPSVRGLIFDRNGVVLAENLPAYRLELVPEQIADLDASLDLLAELVPISDMERERFLARARRSAEFEQVPLKLKLSQEEVARIEVNRQRLDGVYVRAGLTRNYPLGSATAHLIGYVGGITARDLERVDAERYRGASYIGKTGIEFRYESLLHGLPGRQLVEANASGRRLRELEYTPATAGKTLHLTLDAELQRVAEAAFADRNGAAVALDVHTGEILAMVSVPSFDPSLFVDGISHRGFQKLTDDTNRPLFHRAIQGQYPPGSTIKPLMALAGLDHEIFHTRTRVNCPGYYQLPDNNRKHRDWKRRGHGPVDVHEAIAQSCDVYFYDLAHQLEIDPIHDFLQQFGLGAPTGIDLPNEGSGLLPSRAWKMRARAESWFPGETLNIGIGQGFMLTTPLQLAFATAQIATQGHAGTPHLLHSVEDEVSGEQRYTSTARRAAIKLKRDRHWRTVHDAMIGVIHGPTGTARRMALGATYQIAGKTGTAQVAGLSQEDDEAPQLSDVPLHLRDHSLFVGYAPADAPRIAVAAIAEHSGSGSAVAAPIVRRIMDHALGVPAPEEPSP